MTLSTYEKWQKFAMEDELNYDYLGYLTELRNNGVYDENLHNTFRRMGIIGSPDANGDRFQEFLDLSGITLEDLNCSSVNIRRFADGFIVPSWSTGRDFLFAVNHNKERISGLDAKYINIYPDGMKEHLSNFRFYGLEGTHEALEKGFICVCEGIFDRIRLESEGIPAITTLGSQISPTQLRVLNRFDKVILVGDNDRAGRKSQDIILRGVKRTQQLLIGYAKDVDELAIINPEEFKALLSKIRA